MFTAGLGAYWWANRHGNGVTGFLVKRRLWLILLEFTVFRFVLDFSLFQGPILLVVLWALGCSMIALGPMARLPKPVLAAMSLGMITLHNLLDPIRDIGGLWKVLHQQGAFQVGSVTVVAAYPLIPWVGVMGAGYCFGEVMKAKSADWIRRFGLVLILGFVMLRLANIYGEPDLWDGSVLSFFKCTKYPPSLAFLLMTLGPALALLGWFGHLDFSETNPLIVFGRTPLFYFIGHFYLARLIAVAHKGVELPGVYLIWIAVVVAMYPLCLWFMGVKERRSRWWLAYL